VLINESRELQGVGTLPRHAEMEQKLATLEARFANVDEERERTPGGRAMSDYWGLIIVIAVGILAVVLTLSVDRRTVERISEAKTIAGCNYLRARSTGRRTEIECSVDGHDWLSVMTLEAER
jgi:hypothetical protein